MFIAVAKCTKQEHRTLNCLRVGREERSLQPRSSLPASCEAAGWPFRRRETYSLSETIFALSLRSYETNGTFSRLSSLKIHLMIPSRSLAFFAPE